MLVVIIMNRKFRILILFSIIWLCVVCTSKSFENDTFYVIKLGDYIYHNGIDMLDHYSFINNLSYTYPHWLYDLFLYLIYNAFGYFGVYISNIIFFIILIFSFYYICLKMVKNEFISGFTSLILILILSSFVSARAQIISITLFLWEFYFINKLNNTGKKKYMFYLFIICILLANIHATIWPMFFILFLPYLFEYILFNIRNKIHISRDKIWKCIFSRIDIINNKNFKILIITFIISLFLGIFSPSKICYTYVFKIMGGSSQLYIDEHLPLVIYKEPGFCLFFLLFVFIMIISKLKIDISDLCMILGISFMAISSSRHLIFFYTIALLLILKLCDIFIDSIEDKSFDILIRYICNKYVYVMLLLFISICSIYKFVDNKNESFVPSDEYPVEAVKYIKNNLDYRNIKIFNDYNYGSYLLFNDIPVFIDSRSDLYMKQFNPNLKYDIFNDYINIVYNYEDKFDYYGIEYVLEYRNSKLSLILYKDSNYQVLYSDEYFVLFKKGDIYET